MKRVLSTILILVIAGFSLTTCKNQGKKSEEEKEVIKIGAILPLTGPLSQIGSDEKFAIDMALKEINEKKKQITVIYEDSKGKGKEGLLSVNKMKNQGVNKFILSTTPIVNAVLSHYKGDTSLLFFAQCMTPNILENHNNAARIYMTVDMETDLMRDYINKMNYNKIGVLFINNDFGKSATNMLIDKIGTEKIVSSQTFSFSDKNYKNQLNKIKKNNPEAIVIYSYPTQWINLVKQIEELNFNYNIIANSGFSFVFDNDIIAKTTILSNIVFPAPNYIYDSTSNAVLDFNNKLKEFGGDQVNYDILFFYDLMKIIAKNSEESNQKFLKKITSNKYYGISGEIKFNNENDVTLTDLKLAHVVDNKLNIINLSNK